MPRRYHPRTRQWVYRFLILRDGGEHCQECGLFPGGTFGQQIDHIDGNKNNEDPPNLRLLCARCNVTRENIRRGQPRRKPKCPRERENPQTRIVKAAVPYATGSAEMQANLLYEVDFRTWLSDFLRENGFITKKEAVNAGAEVVGCNPTTATKYLAKLTSIVGPMIETTDMLQGAVITMRPPEERSATD